MKTQQQSTERERRQREFEINGVVDEYIALNKELEEQNVFEKLKKMDRLKDLMKAAIMHVSDDDEVVLHGNLGDVTLSACVKQKEVVDKVKLCKLLGKDRFFELAQFNLKVLGQELSGKQLDSVCKVYYGSRRLKHISYSTVPKH